MFRCEFDLFCQGSIILFNRLHYVAITTPLRLQYDFGMTYLLIFIWLNDVFFISIHRDFTLSRKSIKD
jgi:hypothetical protein